MRSGSELALMAMKKEHARLSRAAAKAKAEADENCSIGSEFVAIHKELAEIVSSGEHGEKTLKRLDELKRRRIRADKIINKDILKLLDRQSALEWERDALGNEIHMMEWRASLRNGASQ